MSSIDNFVGGLVGYILGGNIENSYATGDVTGNGYVGGLVGMNDGFIDKTYALGMVTGTTKGGLVGKNTFGTITDSFSLTSPVIEDSGDEKGKVTDASASEMKTKSLYTDDTLQEPWNFENIWKIDEGTTSPYLQNNIPDEKPVPEQTFK